jgi:Ca2+-binding RTX toxin-like protein
MANIAFFGSPGLMNAPDFTGLFTDPIISSSTTMRVIGLSPPASNYVYTITGTGFTYDGGGDFSGGTITGLSGADSGSPDFNITGLSISAIAAQALFEASDDQGFLGLLIAGDDNIAGTSGDDYLTGGGGGDFLFSGDGADTLEGGDEGDFLQGGAGGDRLDGGAGGDVINYFGSAGVNINLTTGATSGGHAAGDTLVSIENIIGSEVNDTLTGDAFGNSLNGSSGDDSIAGLGGTDFLEGGAGADTLDGGADNDDLQPGEGADSVIGGSGVDILRYTSGAAVNVNLTTGAVSGGDVAGDTISGVEHIYSTTNNDTLTGDSAGNFFLSLDGADSLSGLGGADTLTGGNGNDTADGGANNDNLSGEAGADLLRGGDGDDTIDGGSSPDTIFGGLGADILFGGTALDTIDYSDRVDGGVNVNVINGVALTGGFVNASGFYQGGAQEDTISDFENINGTGFADRLVAGSTSARIEGRGGNDYLFTFSGNDTIFGGDGNDFISTAKSSDMVNGENGDDTLNGGTGLDTLNGGANTDTADYSDRTGAVSINLTSGAAVTGGALNMMGFYSGGFTEDSLVSIESALGSDFGDRLVAGASAGRLDGRGGADNISGLGANDTLVGGAGADTLGGGAGNDTFEFASGFGADRVTDFVEGAGLADVIRLVGLGAAFDTFAEVIAAASQSGGDVVFNFGGGNTITVVSATVAGFASNDFTFG